MITIFSFIALIGIMLWIGIFLSQMLDKDKKK